MPLKLNRNFAILYGIMLGDGCLSLFNGKKKYISISGNMYDDVAFFNKIVKPIIKSQINKDIPIKYKKSKNAIELNFIKNSLFDFISSFGFPIGKKGNRLFIPKIFYDKKMVKYVLKGFFATDGSLVLTNNNGTIYPRIEANGIAKNLIKEISEIINLKGIKCNFYQAKRNEHSYLNWKEQYRIQINGRKNLKKFIAKIGFINPKQIEKVQRYYGSREI
ncbi:MAG: LAGLIDADG family homing endonuclease [Candidatus Nanoarchaeia archaeon]